MATTTNKPVSPPPLPQKRGLDAQTKQRLDSVSKKGFGDVETGREIYNSMEGSVTPPGKMMTPKKFPVVLFLAMVIIDILDIIAGLFDITGIVYVLRVAILNGIPTILVLIWVGKTGKEYKTEMNGKIDKMAKRAKRMKGGKGGGKVGGSKKLGKMMDKLIKKVMTKKAGKKILGFLLAGMVPFLAFFALWSVFVISFHRDRKKMAEKTNKSFEDMYKLQNRQQ